MRGSSSLEDYELLELLLFYSIPVKDTKGLAKHLISSLGGSLKDVLASPRERIKAVEGAGDKTSLLISSVRELTAQEFHGGKTSGRKYEYDDCGSMLISYYGNAVTSFSVLLSYDNDMNLIGVDKIYDIPFFSGAVRASRFIEAAVRRAASAVVVAFNHPMGPNVPFPSEIQTNGMLRAAFSEIGLTFVESYLICADSYVGTLNHWGVGAVSVKRSVPQTVSDKKFFRESELGAFQQSLANYLSFARKVSASEAASALIAGFGGIYRMFETRWEKIEKTCESREVAILVSLAAAISSRVCLSALKRGVKYSPEAVKLYTTGIFCQAYREESHILCFDDSDRFLGSGKVNEGTINSLEIIPRRILDIACELGASGVIMVHNHPNGSTNPSDEDLRNTEYIEHVLNNSGIKLVGSMIYSGGEAKEFNFSDMTLKKKP